MKPNIVFIIPGKANPHRLNGVNKVVYSVASEIYKSGYPVAVWGISSDTNNSFPYPYPFPLILFKGNVRNPFFPKNFRKNIAKQPAGTVFHLHGVLNPLYFMIAIYLKIKGFSYVITPHGALLKKSLRRGFWYKYPYLYLLERFVLRGAKAVHCITTLEKDSLRGLCKSSKIKIIPNGTIVSSVPQPSRAKHEEPVFLYMGRFDKEHKGLDIALEAFAVFYQKIRKGAFILVGSGKDEIWLQNRIKELHFDHQITLYPPQFDQDKDFILHHADIFVHPSRWDVMPTASLEAAAAGKPLIMSKATGFGSKIHNYRAGWTTYTDHTSELAQKFLLAYKKWTDGKLDDIGLNAQKMIQDRLLWSAIVPDYYRKLYRHD